MYIYYAYYIHEPVYHFIQTYECQKIIKIFFFKQANRQNQTVKALNRQSGQPIQPILNIIASNYQILV